MKGKHVMECSRVPPKFIQRHKGESSRHGSGSANAATKGNRRSCQIVSWLSLRMAFQRNARDRAVFDRPAMAFVGNRPKSRKLLNVDIMPGRLLTYYLNP